MRHWTWRSGGGADVHRPAILSRYPVLIAASFHPRQIQNLGALMAFCEAGANPKPITYRLVIKGVRLAVNPMQYPGAVPPCAVP